MTLEVRRGRTNDITIASQVLADAFQDYPWTRWTVEAERHTDRIEVLQQLALAEYVMPHGEAWVGILDGEMVSVACWMLPNKPIPPERFERTASLRKKFEGNRHEASLAADSVLEPLKPAHPAYYLATIGTRPSHQGEGIGKAVLQPMLDRIRTENAAAYLETSSPANVRFYTGLGFTVTHHLFIPGGGPETWVMEIKPS